MDAFIGEIRLLPYTFTPYNWFACNGQQLIIQQFPALYAVMGVDFGGDGKTYFNLPNLNGRTAVGAGDNPTSVFDPNFASYGGANSVAISQSNVPAHTHELNAVQLPQASRSDTPAGNLLTGIAFRPTSGTAPTANPYGPAVGSSVTLNNATVSPFVGGSNPHENRQPALAMQWCVCNDGYFPVRP